MQLRDLSDAFFWIRRLIFRVDRLESGAMLENSSISNGRMRFIGGTLLIDSGGQLVVVGSASVDGTLTVDGTFLLTGNGWRIVGSGSIEGDMTVIGPLKIDGDTRITGNLGLEGDIALTGNLAVEPGGKIVADGVRIEDGKVHVGGMVLDPDEHGGAVKFPNGSQVFTDSNTIQVFKGNSVVQVSDGYARLQNGGNVVEIDPAGIRMSPAAIPTTPGTGLPMAGIVIQSATGYLRKSDGT